MRHPLDGYTILSCFRRVHIDNISKILLYRRWHKRIIYLNDFVYLWFRETLFMPITAVNSIGVEVQQHGV